MKYTIQDLEVSETALRHGINNRIPDRLLPNALLTITTLNFIPGRFTLTSGYRCKELNDLLPGASKTSKHMEALAADLWTPTRADKCLLIQFIVQRVNFDQLILESGWVHLGIAKEPRKQILDKNYVQLTVNELLKKI